MNKLLLFSVACKQSRDNFNKTIDKGLSFNEIIKCLDATQLNQLDCISNNDLIYIWGLNNSEYYKRKISSIKPDDVIAFSIDKKFVRKGKVINVIKNKLISKFCWGEENYSNIILIKDIVRINLPYEIIFNDLSYNPKAKINGLVIVDQDRINNLLQKSKTIDEYFSSFVINCV